MRFSIRDGEKSKAFQNLIAEYVYPAVATHSRENGMEKIVQLKGCDEIKFKRYESADGESIEISMNNESIWIGPENVTDFCAHLIAFKNQKRYSEIPQIIAQETIEKAKDADLQKGG